MASLAGGAVERVDMHVHTRYSHDCLTDPEAVAQAAFSRGIKRICVADHNEIAGALELRSRYPGRVIVGEEVKTAEGVDVIGLYISERIPAGTPAARCCSLIHEQGGLVYIPHPFGGWRRNAVPVLRLIADSIDVVEGYNARVLFESQNRRAVEWALERGLPLGAGSDAHTIREVGRAYVEVPGFEDTPGAFLDALRRGRIRGRRSSAMLHIASTYAKVMDGYYRESNEGGSS